jgi:hypothetical protein
VETQDASSPIEPRFPTLSDLLFLCRCLNEASSEIELIRVQNVVIPFASARLLWLTKQTHREKDALDRAFLAELLKQKNPPF